MSVRMFLMTFATGLVAYWLIGHVLEAVWAVSVAAWLSSVVAFFAIAFGPRNTSDRANPR